MKTKLIIFGITGDLSTRKLLPALGKVIATGDFDDLTIIGVSRRHVEKYELLGEHHEQLQGTTSMFMMDLEQKSEYDRLREYIDLQPDEQAIFYLSVPPASSGQIVELLGQAGLNSDNTKLLLEKPFGTDLASARDMIDHVGQYFTDAQVYRIDHYLAKEMAQNIVIFRASNALFSSIWNNQFIEKIEVIASERIGIEGRAQFYEQTGALRDIVQGHLMQLLSLVLMDVSADISWSDMPARRLEAVRALEQADPAKSLRGQYATYREEVEHPSSAVETFVRLELQSNDASWQGVPLMLATGKALAEKRTEVRVHFRRRRDNQADCLIFSIQPNEGVELDVYARQPGYERALEQKAMRFDYAENQQLPDAYEQVIVDAIRSHKSLFASSEEVVRSWKILQPVQQAWIRNETPMVTYQAGTAIDQITAT